MKAKPISAKKPRAVKANGYDAVNKRGQGRVGASPERTNEDGLLPSHKRTLLIATQREIFRNTSFTPATALQLQINVVGTVGGKLTLSTEDADFNMEAMRTFRKWARHCNFTDGVCLNEILQLLLIQLTHNGGDFLAVFDDGCLTGGRGTGKLRIFETDEIKNVEDAEFVRIYGKDSRFSQSNGIVYDEFGRVCGAFVSTHGRNDDVFKAGDFLHLKLDTPADFSESNWILVANRWRVNQGRGVSTAVHVTNLLQDLADTQGSEVQAAKLNAGLGLVVTETEAESAAALGGSRDWLEADGGASDGSADDPEADEAAENAALRQSATKLMAGQSAIVKLAAGKRMDSFKTERPNLNTVEFIRNQRIEAGTVFGLGPSYSTLEPAGSYTAFRGEMSMVERAFAVLRKKLERDFLDWCALRVIKWAGLNAPEDVEDCLRWRWPDMIEVDEGAAQTALQKRYQNAVENLDPLVADGFIKERAAQTEKFHAAGLVAPWEVSTAGAVVTPDAKPGENANNNADAKSSEEANV